MSVDFVKPAAVAVAVVPAVQANKPVTYGAAKPVSAEYLAGPGSVRIQHVMYLFGKSRFAIFASIKAGHFPPPTGHDPRPYWSNTVIRQLLDGTYAINCAGSQK
jgi:hypothetical protein